MGRQTCCLRVATQIQNLFLTKSIPSFRYADSNRLYPAPITQSLRRQLLRTSCLLCFSQIHSPTAYAPGFHHSPTLCATVLQATYFCSWNLTAFSIRESTGFVKAFCKIFANFIILHSFNSLLQIRIHKSESVSAYPCC